MEFTGFRALRLMRPLMMVPMFTGLKAIFESLARNFERILNVVVIMIFFLTLFAVAGQQLFQGVLQARCVTGESGLVSHPAIFCHSNSCPANMKCNAEFGDPLDGNVGYDNIGQAMLGLFVFSTYGLDSMYWVQQAWEPTGVVTCFYLVVFVVMALVINNLFVAVICFGFSRASQDIAKELEERAAASLASMDVNGDNKVSEEEFIAAGGTKRDFIAWDLDGDGQLDENEIAQRELTRHQQQKYETRQVQSGPSAVPESSQLDSVADMLPESQAEDSNTIKEADSSHVCVKLATTVYEFPYFNTIVTAAILVNTVFMSMVYHGMSNSYENVLETAEMCFTLLFLFEMIIKLAALGISGYMRDSWNLMDGCIVVVGIADMVLQIGGNVAFVQTLRLVRVAKALRGLRDNKSVQTLLKASLGSGVPMLNSVLFLLLLLAMFGIHTCCSIVSTS